MSRMDPILQLEGVAKTYTPGLFRKPVSVLESLDLTVRRGEIYGFLGVNGAGKTTTFKIVLGLLRATRGRGQLLGLPLGHREARARIGFLPELPAYYPHLTVRELLRFGRDLSGVARDDARDARLLEELGVDVVHDRSTRKLSKGQLQRLGLAQALAHEPEFLILDEPMSGLDPVARGRVKEVLRAQHAAGRTLLLSTHILADIEVLADRIGLLSGGRLVMEGTPRDLLAGSPATVVLEGAGGLPADALSGMPEGSTIQVAPENEAWSIHLDSPSSEQLDACLRRLVRGGARVHAVETRREDLESFFLRSFGGEAQRWA